MPAVADITTIVQAPHVSGKEFKRNTKTGFQCKKIDRNGIKIRENLWR
jgi:hypothetical protein